MKLKLGKDLAIPLDAVTQTFGVVAARGSGKTYLTAVIGEEMIGAGMPVCALDPIGVYWGWRSSSDGKRDGLPVVILGGEHADVPLEASAGKVIADWVVDERRPCVLDLSLFRKGEQRQFVTDFAEQLYRKNRDPLHLILDEADLFAPQRPMPGEQRMLGAIEDLVRRGRARGLGLTLVTQRPAVLHKDVLTQVSVLVALRMLGPQDRDAVDAWIKFHGDGSQRKTVLESLPSLPIGTAWFWSPGWLGILQKVAIRKRQTFDSSSTPEVGAKRIVPAKMAPVDLEALSSKISATIEKQKADDPRELRKRIADLEKQLKAKPNEPLPVVERIEVPVLDTPSLQAIARMADEAKCFCDNAQELLAVARDLASRSSVPLPAVVNRDAKPGNVVKPVRRAVNGAARDDSIGTGGKARMLIALAQRPQGLNHRQLGLRAGLSSRSGSFSTYLSSLRAAGAIDGRDPIRITDQGIKLLGHYEPLPEGGELLDYWLRELGSGGASRMLQALADAYPRALTQDELGAKAEISARSGTFSTYLSRLRGLELVEGRGELKASAELFD